MVEINERQEDGKYVRKQIEVDFVCNKADERVYVQSAFSIPTTEKRLQEERPLVNVGDGFRKVVVTKGLEGDPFKKDTIVIYFDGWVFEGYDDAKSALMQEITTQLVDHKSLASEVKEYLSVSEIKNRRDIPPVVPIEDFREGVSVDKKSGQERFYVRKDGVV